MFKTTDIWQAAALMARGHRLKGLEKIGYKSVAFLYEDSEEVKQQAEDYMYGSLEVDALTIAQSTKTLKGQAFQRLNDEEQP